MTLQLAAGSGITASAIHPKFVNKTAITHGH